jgi:hypothetical protein
MRRLRPVQDAAMRAVLRVHGDEWSGRGGEGVLHSKGEKEEGREGSDRVADSGGFLRGVAACGVFIGMARMLVSLWGTFVGSRCRKSIRCTNIYHFSNFGLRFLTRLLTYSRGVRDGDGK